MIIQASEGINKANYYGSCATAADTAAKTVTIDGFVLEPGARVSVYFSYMNTAASPTLNVSGTGAYTIWFEYDYFYNYNALYELCEFVYVTNGGRSYWMYVGHPSSTLRNEAIGYTEYRTVSRAAHSVGSYITWKDKFYKVSATIAAGDTLAVGTNLTETTVGDVLTELNANLDEVDVKIISETYTNLARMGNANFYIAKSGYRLIDFCVTSINPTVSGVCTCLLSRGGYGFVYNNDNAGNTFTRIPLTSTISGIATFIKP